MEGKVEKLVQEAINGDKSALEKIIVEIKDLVYNLALRMLWHPDDAKDATQESLIKIITNLGSFENKSSFKTWAYRVASNSILNYRQKHFKHSITFEDFENQLNEGFSDQISYTNNEAEQKLLVLEAKVGCSNAMLQCLNKESRLVYILGEILEFNSIESAEILNITSDNFRQKLSRARKNIHQFLHNNCGIIDKKNRCRCIKKVDSSIKKGVINPDNLLFSNDQMIDNIEAIESEVALFQTNPEYQSPEKLIKEVKRIINNTNIG